MTFLYGSAYILLRLQMSVEWLRRANPFIGYSYVFSQTWRLFDDFDVFFETFVML